MTILILFAAFLVFLFLGMPVAFAMGISSVIALFVIGDVPKEIIPQKLFNSVNSFSLMAVPYFVLTGYIMNASGITRRLIDFAKTLVGHFTGGLAQVNVLTSILFGGISGSSSADAAALGATLIPSMNKDGYHPSFSATVTAASSTIGSIIPPSIVMIIYGSMTDVSIGALFIAGIIPGIMIGLSQMLLVHYYSKKRNYKSENKVPFSEVVKKFKEAFWALLAPIIIIGGILAGIFTATEAGVISSVYALVVGLFIYKEIRFMQIKKVFVDSIVMTATPIIILGMASTFGWVITREKFSFLLINLVQGISDNANIILLIIITMLLLIGLFVESLAAMVIFVPVLSPLVVHFGWDPLHFAIIVIIALLIGTVTPPVGIQLYIAAAIAKVSILKMKEIWAFVFVMVIVLLLLAYIPQLVTFLPNLVNQ